MDCQPQGIHLSIRLYAHASTGALGVQSIQQLSNCGVPPTSQLLVGASLKLMGDKECRQSRAPLTSQQSAEGEGDEELADGDLRLGGPGQHDGEHDAELQGESKEGRKEERKDEHLRLEASAEQAVPMARFCRRYIGRSWFKCSCIPACLPSNVQ